jgi:superfamily II DNA or RNA helicase
MTKAILSNRIYFRPKDSDHFKELIRELTYKIEGKPRPGSRIKPVTIIRNYKSLPNGVISIPQGRLDLIPEDYEIEDKRVQNVVPFPEPKFPLRDSQQPVYDEVEDTCFINALVGWGKTFTALWIAKKWEQKTLVITHTVALRDQWVNEVKSLYGIEPGIIGAGKFDIKDHCIVVGNVQTVTKLIPKISKEFGTVILDEAHHVPAETFSQIIDGMYARYRLALSGTMRRTDGKHVIFKDYFGDRVYKPPQSHTLNPLVKLVPSGVHLTHGAIWAKKINDLLYNTDYQEFISEIAKRHILQGYSVLIVASRVEFLESIKEQIGETCVLVTGKVIGEERDKNLKQIDNGEKMCVAATTRIFSEGISINRLSCVILAEPTSNPITLEQVIGRVMRLHPDKKDPVVIDIQFSGQADRRQNSARTAFYASKDWKVIKV